VIVVLWIWHQENVSCFYRNTANNNFLCPVFFSTLLL
jgi:hypothetical protein